MGVLTSGDEDWYALTLAGGEAVSVGGMSLGVDDVSVELVRADGVGLAAGAAGTSHFTSMIEQFVVPTGGTYYVRVTGEGSYSVLVARGSAIENEARDDLSLPLDISGAGGTALGALHRLGLAVEPDDFSDYQDIREAVPGVTLSVEGSYGKAVLASPSEHATTGDQAFGHSNKDYWVEDNLFRADFDQPVTRVSLDFVTFLLSWGGDAILQGFNADGNLVAKVVEHFPDLRAETITISRPVPDIAYIIAGDNEGNSHTYVALDNLVVNDDLTDTYTISVQAGDTLTITTSTPGDAGLLPLNDLDAAIELLDPTETLVASDDNCAPDGRNAMLTHVATQAGQYTVRVLNVSGVGDYVLDVAGATGALPAFAVSATDPTDGEHVPSPSPTQMTVTFDDDVLLTSLDAGDLTVDGTPATGFAVVDGRSVRFDLPALSDGVHDVAIAAGAILDVQGTPVEAYAGQFEVDVTAPWVAAASIEEGQILPTGDLTVTVTFNEEMDPSRLDVGDVRLHGTMGATNIEPVAIGFDGSATVLTIEFADLADDAYTLSLFSTDFAFRDVVGNLLDGEAAWPLPSGDGTEGGHFVVNVEADADEQALGDLSRSFTQAGGLVYEGSAVGAIVRAGDTDSYTFTGKAGQLLSLVGRPTPLAASLQPMLQLYDPSEVLVGSASAGAVGQDAVLETLLTADGTYKVVVSAVGGNTGGYELQAVFNAALEDESYGGARNDTLSAAQDLDGAFTDLVGSAQRAAVTGELTSGTDEDWYAMSLAGGEAATVAGVSADINDTLQVSLTDASGAALAEGDVHDNARAAIERFVPDAAGTFYIRVTGEGPYGLLVTRNADADLEGNDDQTEAQDITRTGTMLGALHLPWGRIRVEPDDYPEGADLTNVVEGVALTVENGPTETVSSRYYEIVPTGSLLFASDFGGEYNRAYWRLSAEAFRADFVEPIARVDIDTIEYAYMGICVLQAYDAGDNLIEEAQVEHIYANTTSTLSVASPTGEIAYIIAGGIYYHPSNLDNLRFWVHDPADVAGFAVRAGDALTVQTLPTLRPDQPDQLDPMLELVDPDGIVVASDDNSAGDGLNAYLTHTATKTGQYTVRVLGAGGTGEYLLSVDGHTGDLAAFEVTGLTPADGAVLAGPVNPVTVTFSDDVLLTSLDPSDLTIDGQPATAVTMTDGRTAVFDLPTFGPGVHTLTIAAGAILDVQATPVAARISTFELGDLPRVLDTSLHAGDIVAPGDLTMTVTFSEAMNASLMGTDDVELVGAVTGAVEETTFSYDVPSRTLTLGYMALPADTYTLTLLDGRFEDTLGRLLDGEANWPPPSGDGVEGGAFAMDFQVDPQTGVISGQVFGDILDANVVRDGHEVGINGVTVELIDADTGEVIATTVTGEIDVSGNGFIEPTTERGLYSFTGLPAGNYEVRQVVPLGYSQRSPSTFLFEDSVYTLEVASGTPTIVELGPTHGAVRGTFLAPGPVEQGFQGMAMGDGRLFLVDGSELLSLTLWELDPATGGVIDKDILTFDVIHATRGLGYLNGHLYIPYLGTKVAVWDPDTDTLVRTLEVEENLVYGLTGAPDLEVLFGNDGFGNIFRVDPVSGDVLDTLEVDVLTLGGLAYVGGELLGVDSYYGGVTRFDPDTGEVLGNYFWPTYALSQVGLAGEEQPVAANHVVALTPGQALETAHFANRASYVLGDLNGDGLVDAADIDTLRASYADPAADPLFDLDGDGDADIDDTDVLVHDILGTEYGDTNLDRIVDIVDLALMRAYFGRPDLGWAGADINGDGVTDLADLTILRGTFGFIGAPPADGAGAPDGGLDGGGMVMGDDGLGGDVASLLGDGAVESTEEGASVTLSSTDFDMAVRVSDPVEPAAFDAPLSGLNNLLIDSGEAEEPASVSLVDVLDQAGTALASVLS